MLFKDLLRELREKAGITQQALADGSGIPLGSVRGYEQGHRIPSWPAVAKMAKIIGVSTEAFSHCDEVGLDESAKPAAKKKGGKR